MHIFKLNKRNPAAGDGAEDQHSPHSLRQRLGELRGERDKLANTLIDQKALVRDAQEHVEQAEKAVSVGDPGNGRELQHVETVQCLIQTDITETLKRIEQQERLIAHAENMLHEAEAAGQQESRGDLERQYVEALGIVAEDLARFVQSNTKLNAVHDEAFRRFPRGTKPEAPAIFFGRCVRFLDFTLGDNRALSWLREFAGLFPDQLPTVTRAVIAEADGLRVQRDLAAQERRKRQEQQQKKLRGLQMGMKRRRDLVLAVPGPPLKPYPGHEIGAGA